VPEVGYPEPQTFEAARAALAELHDRLWAETGVGPERTVLGGFSMGAVMSHALGWSGDRPPVAGVMAFSGFVPTVPGWQPSLADRSSTRAFVAHGDRDPVIGVEFGRAARDLLERGGIDVTYVETPVGHQIDPASLAAASAWLPQTLGL
jgi:phospholipase/carboxylesterase